MKTALGIVATALALNNHVAAFWRMECQYETGLGRMDPIVDPGEVSAHVHTFMGSNGIHNFTADSATLTAPGTCTSCAVTQDHSAYWTPALYFAHSDGRTELVQQVGGMLAYYLPYLDNIQAFPEGFQMVAGNPNLRNFTGPFPDTPLSSWPTDSTGDQFFLQQRAIGFNCLNYGKAPEPSLYRHVMPSKEYLDAECVDGLRLELAFPSCGNGESDSSDHKSHVAYPSLVKEGNCPAGYDAVHYPFLFYETIWATDAFAGQQGEFLLSYGDPVGTGYHGDFLMGWESQQFLQGALDTCTDLSGEISACPLFNIQSAADAANCKLEVPDILLDDDCHGPRQGLPVDVPIQYGPELATTYPIAGRTGQPTTSIDATLNPSKLHTRPAVTYSPANAKSTGSAMGGIVVAALSTPTEAPVEEATVVSTMTCTTGMMVEEMVINEVIVTETSTLVARVTAAPSERKRHLHRHAHYHHHHH